ncbi:hypothetical protein TWF694_005800 [Orbilia ellipsospora]|uniref:Major facilitator superfamily (MFS) profile domain-containing protein n=1 Tax=Orbilia ellipsospora TaxID=2528407 RepID=A0AAV9WS25_9PEZI
MWQQRRPTLYPHPLTPVREESISSKHKSGATTPRRDNSNPVERADSAAESGVSSDTYRVPHVHPRIPKSADASSTSADESTSQSATTEQVVGDTSNLSTIMAEPVLGDEKKLNLETRRSLSDWGVISSSVGCSVEAYTIFLPVFLIILFSFVQNRYDEDNMMQMPLSVPMLLKLSIFIGMPFGSIFATILSRRFHENNVLCGFLCLVFIAQLGMTLTGNGPSIEFFSLIIFWRSLVGVGVGGLRGITALTTVRTANPQWRGLRMMRNGFNNAMGYITVCIAALSSLWLWERDLKQNHCGGSCRLTLDKMWRFISGVIIANVACGIITRIIANRNVAKPIKLTPKRPASFSTFRRSYRHPRYLWPLCFLSLIAFFSSMIFYPMLLNLPTIFERAEYTVRFLDSDSVRQYLLSITSGLAIMAGAGIVLGYITLACLVDAWGRKRMLLLSYTLLAPTLTVLAGIWPRMSMEVRMLLICLTFMLLITGPIGVGYVYASEMFPRAYRTWCFTIVDVVGVLGAIAGIVATEYMLQLEAKQPSIAGVRILFAFYAGCLMPGFLGTFGLVETTRKEVGVVEGEIYGDWGKWEDRRKMRPNQREKDADIVG